MSDQGPAEYVLGIDLGSNSLGWAIVGLVDGEPARLVRAGVRVFDAGMEGDIESGREQSKNLKRREARLHRRQLWRRARRLTKIFNLLQRFGLLPSVAPASSPADGAGKHRRQNAEDRQDFVNRLDQAIRASAWFKDKAGTGLYPEPDQTLPYILRAAALDEPLEPHFLGRAFYHLAQRRGFLSNRLKPAKKEDDQGEVKKGIHELRGKMGNLTLGQYLASLSPSERRIRGRWTARSMYEEEFERIWTAQAQHHPALLTPERKKELQQALFFQRPLWFDPDVIGRCELEPEERRAPAYLLTAQRFRLLQTVNNLRVLPPGQAERDLSTDERKKLLDILEAEGDQTFVRIRKLLSLKGCEFNLERGGEKRIKGNRTNADFHAVFGDRWLKMSPDERDHAVEYVHAFQRPDKLAAAAAQKWALDAEAAEKMAEISLEPDYMNLSGRAIKRLLPLLEEGVPYATARKQLYPERFEAGQPLSLLPPVENALTEIRNPAVKRSLTELRKVVNAILREYGKPAQIRIELARDLKKTKKQRQNLVESMRKNEKARAEAAKRIIAEAGVAAPKPDDIRKFLLAEECRWQCPYTGRSISMQGLFGPEPQFDIEHILPFDRSLDNSFTNLTLCYNEENRNVKRGRTPFQAYGGTERYDPILDRVARFTGERRMVAAKLKRFKLNDEELASFLEDFRNRQLNDTAYASSLAARYLGLVYGGVIDAAGNRRVQATSGQTTSYFRSLWKLNSILNDGPSTGGGRVAKSRADHRHHAVDAVVIGLTDAGMVKRLSDAAQRAPREGHKRFAALEGPWPNFVDTARAEIARIVASHRVSKKVSGALHEETNYSPPEKPGRAPLPPRTRRVIDPRVPGKGLSKAEVKHISDDRIRHIVMEKLQALGTDDPQEAFADPEHLPFLPNKNGQPIPIKRVRVDISDPVFPVGKGQKVRYVTTDSNHHVELVGTLDDSGTDVDWDGRVVPMKEAYQRIRSKAPVIAKTCKQGEEYKFSLCPGEVLDCGRADAARRLLVFKGVSQYTAGPVVISLLALNDARKNPKLIRVVPNTLRKWNARKVNVNPLGEVSEGYD